MSTIEILNGLQDYLTLLSAVKDHVTKAHSVSYKLYETVSISYKFISLELNNEENQLYLSCTFEIQQAKTALTEVYCSARTREDELKKFVLHHAPLTVFPGTTNFNNYHPETLKYFNIADSIAKEVLLCSSGDDYRPGYYSEIIVEQEKIILKQINWHNAKSSDHKEDYNLRDLEFLIPLNKQSIKESFDTTRIGEMIINFSDRSSKNNKSCGDRIAQKIEDEKINFQK